MLSWNDEPVGAAKSSPKSILGAAGRGSFRSSLEHAPSGTRGSLEKPGSLTRLGSSGTAPYYAEKDGMKDGKEGWWARMDTGAMNYDIEETSRKPGQKAAGGGGGYIPQALTVGGSRDLWADEKKEEGAENLAAAALSLDVSELPTSPTAPAPTATTPAEAGTPTKSPAGGKEQWQWWSKGDTGHMNEPAVAAEAANKRGGAFVPQYSVKRDLWADQIPEEKQAAEVADAPPLAAEIKNWDPFQDIARTAGAAQAAVAVPCAVAAATAADGEWNPFMGPPAGH